MDYEKMYHILFNAQTDAIKILQKAQIEAENIYIQHKNAEKDDEK